MGPTLNNDRDWNRHRLWWLFLGALIGFATRAAFGQEQAAASMKPLEVRRYLPAVPSLAVDLAAVEMSRIAPLGAPHYRFVWSNGANKEELDRDYVAVTTAVNTALNRSSVEYAPPRLAGNSLMLIDFTQLGRNGKDVDYLLYVWNEFLAPRDTFFHSHPIVKVTVKPESKGTKGSAPIAAVKEAKTIHIANPDLGPNAIVLERLCGNFHPAECSYSPVVRADWFTSVSTASIDGGLYLKWLGLTPGHSKLDDFLESIGAPIKLAQDNDAVGVFLKRSEVTRKPRKIRWWYGANLNPERGLPLNSITDDFFNQSREYDVLAGKKDVFDSPLDAPPDGHEVIPTLRNGWPAGIVANGQRRIVDQAPPNLVADRRTPDGHDTILNGIISCMRCHAAERFVKTIRDDSRIVPLLDVRTLLEKHTSHRGGVPVVDFKGLFANKQFEEYQQLRAQFTHTSERIDNTVLTWRRAINTTVFGTLHVNSETVFADTARVFDDYEYGPGGSGVNALVACRDLGFTVDEAVDQTGIETFKQVVPPRLDRTSGPGAIFNQLTGTREVMVTEEDPQAKGKTRETMKLVGLEITRRQWERVFPDAYAEAMKIHKARANPQAEEPIR